MFEPDQTEQSVSVTIRDDGVVEPSIEDFLGVITPLQQTGVLTSQDTATIRILDDEGWQERI